MRDYNVFSKCSLLSPKEYIYLLGCVPSCPERTVLDPTESECIDFSSSGIFNF